jgi:hypothetical protein
MRKKDISKQKRDVKRIVKREKRLRRAYVSQALTRPVSLVSARQLLKWRFVIHIVNWVLSLKSIRICDTISFGSGFVLSMMNDLPKVA